ncbi:ribosomal protein L1, partial [Mycena sanguinolenta]
MALIDGHVSDAQCKKAVDALHAHITKHAQKKEGTELLGGKDQNIWLNVSVKKIASAHKFKPVKIPIAHPLIDPRTTSICLITKDPQRKYKDLLTEHNIKFISRVVGIEKLKGKFKPFEARRMLLRENGMFLADDRVVQLLPKLLGVKWFEAKKQPIPVCLTRKDLKAELERAVSSTYMNQNQGTCTAIKIASSTHTPAQILDNLRLAIPAVVGTIKGGWDNVKSLLVKSNSSAGLPVWTCELGVEPVADDVQASDDEEDEEMEVEEAPTKKRKGDPIASPGAKKAKSSPALPEPAPSTSAEKKKAKKGGEEKDAPTPASAKKSKGKSAAEEAPTPASAEKKAKTKAAPTPAPTPSKSKSKSTPAPVADAEPETPPAPPASKKAKSSKAKADAAASDVPPKKSKSDAPPAPSDAPAKKSKADKLASAEKPTPAAPAPSLTSADLKQKRAGKPGEGKKEKVAAVKTKTPLKGILKGGKGSAKEGVVGRKRAA